MLNRSRLAMASNLFYIPSHTYIDTKKDEEREKKGYQSLTPVHNSIVVLEIVTFEQYQPTKKGTHIDTILLKCGNI